MIAILLVSGALAATVALFAPLHVFLTNPLEFAFLPQQAVAPLAVLACGLALVLWTVGLAVPRRFRTRFAVVCLGIAWLIWAHGNLLVWTYGPLTGSDIAWDAHAGEAAIEVGLWVAALVALWVGANAVRPAIAIAALLLITIQAIAAAQLIARQPEVPVSKYYTADPSSRFSLSRDLNVIVIVLDMFQSDVFAEILDQDETVARSLSGFTYFPDTTSGFGATFASLTHLFTGRQYDNSLPLQKFVKQSFLAESSLPLILRRQGYGVSLYTNAPHYVLIDPRVVSNLVPKTPITYRDVARLLDLGLFRYGPTWVKRFVFADNAWRLQPLVPDRPIVPTADLAPAPPRSRDIVSDEDLARFEQHWIVEPGWASDMLAQITARASKPVLRFYHLRGPHYPLRMNDRLQFAVLPPDRAGYTSQARGSLKLVERFLDELRRLGVYDNTFIVVAGDHGYRGPAEEGVIGVRAPAGFEACPPAAEPPVFEHVNMKGSALPLLLVKRPGRSGPLERSSRAASLGDVPATILAALGIDAPAEGIDLFSAGDTGVRTRRFIQDDLHGMTHDGYYRPMREYHVTGPAWCDASWRWTGRTLVAASGSTR